MNDWIPFVMVFINGVVCGMAIVNLRRLNREDGRK